MAGKSPQAFRTIGELADELGIAQHILRYWETRFPQLRPLQRAGNRRYYRPDDVALAKRIHRLLNQDGYTIRGVQQVLSGRNKASSPEAEGAPAPAPSPPAEPNSAPPPVAAPAATGTTDRRRLREIRDGLAAGLADTAPSEPPGTP